MTKISPEAQNEDLMRTFSCVGEVVKAYIIRKGGVRKAYDFGYVVFKEVESARRAVELGEFRVKGMTVLCRKYKGKDDEEEDICRKDTGGSREFENIKSDNGLRMNEENKSNRVVNDYEFKAILSSLKSGEKVMTQEQIEIMNDILEPKRKKYQKFSYGAYNTQSLENISYKKVVVNKVVIDNLKRVEENHLDISNIRFNQRSF